MTRLSRVPLLLAALACLCVAGVGLLLPRLRWASVSRAPLSESQRAAVAGVVQRPDGSPLAGVEVTWNAQEGERSTLGVTTFRGGEIRRTTAADGSFRFDAVPTVEGYAAIADEGCGYEGRSGHVLPEQGVRIEGLRLEAAPIPSDRLLRGRLRHTDGSAASFAQLAARIPGVFRTWQGGAFTDADGVFAILGPWSGATVELSMQLTDGVHVDLGAHGLGSSVDLVVHDGR